ncbi:P-loop containing nucleoside triphosphate hydrolase protein [Mycena leptocephala]|nr:P-loop containing nucleoside triphosphate hydrolase protein [Mycena leptocephala]
MELYSHDTSRPLAPYFYEHTGRDVSDISHKFGLVAGVLLVAFSTLVSRIVANRKVPRCLPRRVDILVALKVLIGMIYIAGTVAMLVYSHRDGKEWVYHVYHCLISEHYHSIAPSTLTSLYAIIGAAVYAYTLYKIQAPRTAKAREISCYQWIPATVRINALLSCKVVLLPHRAHSIHRLPSSHPAPELRDIPLYLRSDPATEKLLAALAIEDKTSSRYLLKSTFRAFSGYFLSPILPRLISLAATFAQVSLVEAMVSYVSDKSIPHERGTLLVAAYFVVYVSLAISNYVYSEKVNAFIVLYRSALTGALYAKTLRLTSMAARELGQGAATTYMAVDVDKATNGFFTLQELWAAVVTIIIACTLLWYKAGYAMFAALLFIVTLLGLTSTISGFVGAAQKAWLEAIDVRIKLLTSVIGQLLPIKLGAYEAALVNKINALRKLETAALKAFVYLIALAATLSNIGSSASFCVTLAAYAFILGRGWGDLPPLDVSRIFTLYTIVNLLNGPLNMIGQTLPQLFASFASLGRIQGFLQLPEKAGSEFEQTKVAETGTGDLVDWDDKDQMPVLTDITLNLSPHELHMVVGSVASGKSSLLMSILGETTLVEGTFRVNAPKIALATQTPFIFPGTLHILLDSAYDEVFYEKVIHACALRQDIETLPRRDMTKLGDKGSTLSGGQRQRLAIARAVYAQADLVLLDDVFSALDGETEAHVFASLFGPDGMLKGKTTVLVTHGVHHLPTADKVIIMDAGKIAHFGSFEEVRDAGAAFALASGAAEADASRGQVGVKESVTAATVDDEEEDEELQWTNERASRTGAYAFYIKCTGVVRTSSFFALITVWSGVGVFATVYLSFLASSSGRHLGLWVAGYGTIVATNLMFMAITLLYLDTLCQRSLHLTSTEELAGVMGSPISWITKNPVGKILNRFSQDIQVADIDFPFAFFNFAVNIFSVLGTFVFITMATPLVGFALPVLAIFGGYFVKFYLATSKQFRRLESASKSPLLTLFGTTVAGLITVRAYRAQGFFRKQNAAFVDESQGARHYQLGGQLFLRVFFLWFQTILACSVALLTVWLRDSTSAAVLGIALSSLVSLGMILGHLLNSYASVENGSVAIDRIAEDHSTWPSTGTLTFSDFSMKYRDDLPLALKNISFTLQGGLKIGICGRTGSGKSSSVLALFRGIDQHLVTGKIVIDGVDISTVPLHYLRESMSIVTQDPFLWHGSIRENLDVTNVCTDSEIWQTLKLVEMYDAVSALEDKLDHLVVDEESFSKGQRQLLCLARALLRKKRIIVLDESTSSMDHITDEKIRHVVDTQMQGLTVLAIAHRISTIVNYDKILVLDSGSVAEFDNPMVLLSNPESRFARLAATQGIYHPDLVPKDVAVKELSDGTAMVVTEDLIDV